MADTPNCTLVTGCFLLTKYNAQSRPLDELAKGLEAVLSTPCYLVMYCNEPLKNLILEMRAKYRLEAMTKIVVQEVEELWAYQFADQIRKNRETYWPTADPRISIESTAVVCNKFNFVLRTIQENPFQTEHVAWIDANLGLNGVKLCIEGDFQTKLMYILKHLRPNKFHVQILNVEDKKYKEDQHKREFYEKARWMVVGGFFATEGNVGIKILTRIQEIIAHTVQLGFGHADEYFYLEVLDDYFDDIHRGYGDYMYTMDNFLQPKKGLTFVYLGAVMGNYSRQYYREAQDAAEAILHSLEESYAEPNYDMYVRVCSALYRCYQNTSPQKAYDMVQKIRHSYRVHPLFRYYYDNLYYMIDMNDFDIHG